MLFDLRSRGRRRTVQVVYLGLALLLGGGLVLFGVGAGNGFGGILNAFTGAARIRRPSRRSPRPRRPRSSRRPCVRPTPRPGPRSCRRATNRPRRAPTTTPATGQYTASGLKELRSATQAWQRYEQLTPHPMPISPCSLRAPTTGPATTPARPAPGRSSRPPIRPRPPTSSTWQPPRTAPNRSRKGDLAAAKAVGLTPQLQRLQVQQQLKQLRSLAVPTTSAPTPPHPRRRRRRRPREHSDVAASPRAVSSIGRAGDFLIPRLEVRFLHGPLFESPARRGFFHAWGASRRTRVTVVVHTRDEDGE